MLKKVIVVFFLISGILTATLYSEIRSLHEIFDGGKILKDNDNDNLIDTIETCIIISDSPTTDELILASEISARINFESLCGNLDLVKRESEIKDLTKLKNPIFIGNNFRFFKKLPIHFSELKENEALISVLSSKKIKGIIILGGSGKAFLFGGRAFFLRYPYVWDIWGRKHGTTYLKIEKDIREFLREKNINCEEIKIISVKYKYHEEKEIPESLSQLKYDFGEIENLTVEIKFPGINQRIKAEREFSLLIRNHSRGIDTTILNYPGCAKLTIILKDKNNFSEITIPRIGFPKRMLTPSYKRISKIKISNKNFDLINIFSEKGIYSDSNEDKILDNLDSYLIIPSKENYFSLPQLCSRLILESAGSSFPLIKKDEEITDYKKLISPIIIGKGNLLTKHLIKIGKLKEFPLGKNEGLMEVIPEAFNKSNALIIIAPQRNGMEKTLFYLAKTYPYLTYFKSGEPEINDIKEKVEEFFNGKHGASPSHFYYKLKELIKKLKNKELEYFYSEFYLPEKNKNFERFIFDYLKQNLKIKKINVETIKIDEPEKIFEKEKEFQWEVEEVLRLINENISGLNPAISLEINLGVSESPLMRQKIKNKIETLLKERGFSNFNITVLSAYKQGFFWIKEKIIPKLKEKNISEILIKFSRESPAFSSRKRFYTEPIRWLQELYPIDEILSQELKIPVEKINFEMIESQKPFYKVEVFNSNKELIFSEEFYPRVKERFYLDILPEWGKVKITTGWLEIKAENKVILNKLIETDLEKFWNFYQKEILPEIYNFIMKKTGKKPLFKKQPYFKRLLIETWFSEPDFKLGLDEEIISSLEALHDEIYFDTLDFLRGITKIEEKEVPEDTSRYSAPGNILPLIHPSIEGKKGKVKIIFEDRKSKKPYAVFKWKEKKGKVKSKKIEYAPIEKESFSVFRLIFNGEENRIKDLFIKVSFKEEKEYLKAIELIHSFLELRENGLFVKELSFPKIQTLTIHLKSKKLEKEIPIKLVEKKIDKEHLIEKEISFPIVPVNKILSPDECWKICKKLGNLSPINFYQAGISYEGRKIPVLEIYLPSGKYVSIPKLITLKPTIYLSGRQHANEVSSTNYILKLAELLVTDKRYKEFVKKINFVLHPMENPDGAQLAHELQKITPFHSLHAGRYSALGIDIGYQVNVKKPILPEAKVRGKLYKKWLPDIYLNLHGYPSHEWVQQFSNYSPYLFRDYWIPRGWFAYYNYLRLPIYENWRKAGEELKNYIIREMNKNEEIKRFNEKLYNRYYRWAGRWQPHMNYLEIHQGLNLYAERRSSRENKLTPRRKITFVEEVPEVMDETAQKGWLKFICEQGLVYLTAHLKYLSSAKWHIVRLEEEYNDRIQIKFIRSRPGMAK